MQDPGAGPGPAVPLERHVSDAAMEGEEGEGATPGGGSDREGEGAGCGVLTRSIISTRSQVGGAGTVRARRGGGSIVSMPWAGAHTEGPRVVEPSASGASCCRLPLPPAACLPACQCHSPPPPLAPPPPPLQAAAAGEGIPGLPDLGAPSFLTVHSKRGRKVVKEQKVGGS